MSAWKYESRRCAVIVEAGKNRAYLFFGRELMRQERLMSEKAG
jgi:hypothetical protein